MLTTSGYLTLQPSLTISCMSGCRHYALQLCM